MHLEFSPLCLNSFCICETSQYLISLCDSVHLDYMDAPFVPSTAFSIDQINNYVTEKDKHVHLMCRRPDVIAKELYSFSSLSAHIEVGVHFRNFKEYMISTSSTWGVVISPFTPVSSLHSLLDTPPDRIVVMAVKPGFSGQPFLSSTLERIPFIKELFPTSKIVIDGGINTTSVKAIKELGVHSCVICSALVNASSKEHYSQQLRS